MENYKKKAKLHHDKRVHKRNFEVGDWVLRKAEVTGKEPGFNKLRPNWVGPFQIARIIKVGTYRLRDKDGKDIKNAWHSDHLKKYYN